MKLSDLFETMLDPVVIRIQIYPQHEAAYFGLFTWRYTEEWMGDSVEYWSISNGTLLVVLER